MDLAVEFIDLMFPAALLAHLHVAYRLPWLRFEDIDIDHVLLATKLEKSIV